MIFYKYLMPNYRTPEQQKLVDEMLELRKKYYDKVEEMWNSFKPFLVQFEGNPNEAIEYMNQCVPDCVPKIFAINYCLDLIDKSKEV